MIEKTLDREEELKQDKLLQEYQSVQSREYENLIEQAIQDQANYDEDREDQADLDDDEE